MGFLLEKLAAQHGAANKPSALTSFNQTLPYLSLPILSIAANKTTPDTLLAKRKRASAAGATETLSAEEQMYVEVLKGAFPEALGYEAIFQIEQRNPKEKV